MTELRETYIKNIRENIKLKYEEGEISKRYSFNSFCNNFIPDKYPLDESESKYCLCGHEIFYNYKYSHKDRDDYFILGSCCIKKFSSHYQNQRKCKNCDCKIKVNKSGLCKECRNKEKEEQRKIKEKEKYLKECECKDCGYQMKNNKYKYCYKCNERRKKHYYY
jgi:hypothetical protein